MVKGINKRVIVVKAPDPRLFEQASFIRREDAFAEGVSAEQGLEEAPFSVVVMPSAFNVAVPATPSAVRPFFC